MVASLFFSVLFIACLLGVVGFGVGVVIGAFLWRKNGEAGRRLQLKNQELEEECRQLAGGKSS